MLNPVKTTARWLAGRVLLFLIILLGLIAWDAYRDESSLLTEQLIALFRQDELDTRLEAGRAEIRTFVDQTVQQINQDLRRMQSLPEEQVRARLAGVQGEIALKQRQRRARKDQLMAILAGKDFEDDLKLEVEIQLLLLEVDALKEVLTAIEDGRGRLMSLQVRVADAESRKNDLCDRSNRALEQRDNYRESHPFGRRFWPSARRELQRLGEEAADRQEDCTNAQTALEKANLDLKRAEEITQTAKSQVKIAADVAAFDPVRLRKAALDKFGEQGSKAKRSVEKVLRTALVVLLAVTIAPIGIKAFWYWLLAPLAARRPPIRLEPWGTAGAVEPGEARNRQSVAKKISSVSQEISVRETEEILVHPNYLQSASVHGRTDTKLLLNCHYPFTSIAAGMVGLTRIRATSSESFVVSSTNDPLAEIGIVHIPAGTALVLQPRNLVGVVQAIDRPIRITRRWVFALGAWITLQFRYLVFEGPGDLMIRGTRGVRVEPVGSGRAIDQRSTIGFSANLGFSPRRSETFGAYLLGARGLFNDCFFGEAGYIVYDENPYAGKRTGIVGRGLEGLTDGLLKVVGI